MARKRASTRPAPRPELLSLLAACKDQPEDDAPRLILADWLEEHGDLHDRARAEFIRLQLVSAAIIEQDEEEPDRKAELALLGQHGAAWFGPLGEALGEDLLVDIQRHERGFLHADVSDLPN